MRQAFAHEVLLSMEHEADIRAPGAAVTVELCGYWEHEPPCPVAAHHTAAARNGTDVRLRILFATEGELETMVRRRIDTVLASGELYGPGGDTTRWMFRESKGSTVAREEAEHALRLCH